MPLENLQISKQTLTEFLDAPFGNKNTQKHLDYETRYMKYKKENKIKVVSTLVLNENYFIHLHVPSESQKPVKKQLLQEPPLVYDVVIQFFTSNEEVKRQNNLKNYYVQFFSNSPGFVYKYATLYKLQGYLIESLMDKFSPGALDTLPEKANKDYELYYDSTIYYACRYLIDRQVNLFGKFTYRIMMVKSPQQFINGIQDFESVNITRDVAKIEKNLKQEIEKDTKLSQEQKNKLKRNSLFQKEINEKDNRKYAKKSTFKNQGNNSVVKKAKTSTSKDGSLSITRIKSKKKARNTTLKK